VLTPPRGGFAAAATLAAHALHLVDEAFSQLRDVLSGLLEVCFSGIPCQ